MASVTSFLALLLITYSYAVPIGSPVGNSTPPYQYTTGQTIVERVSSISMNLMFDNESTVVPTIHQQRSSEESSSNEVTTDYVNASSPVYEQSSYPSSTITNQKRNDYQDSQSAESQRQEKRGVYTYSTSTVGDKKRNDYQDSQSAESESQEKRDVVTFPTSTNVYKKRNDYQDSQSAESQSQNQEKRFFPTYWTSTITNQKRNDDQDSQSAESRSQSQEKRFFPTYWTSTITNQKRNDDQDFQSAEAENQEKRGVTIYPTSTIANQKRNDDQDSQSTEAESQEKRGVEESSDPSSTIENFFFTTLESSTEFNRRAILPTQSQEVLESSTVFWENQTETSSFLPSTSVVSFGKYTGLLKNQSVDESNEELTTSLPVKVQQTFKTISILPGEITETRIFPGALSKPSPMLQPIQQEKLSQGQREPVPEKGEPNN